MMVGGAGGRLTDIRIGCSSSILGDYAFEWRLHLASFIVPAVCGFIISMSEGPSNAFTASGGKESVVPWDSKR